MPPPGPRRSLSTSRLLVLLLIVLAAPSVLAVETGLRRLLLPPDLDALRAELEPALTRFSWILFGLTFAAVVLGVVCKRWLERRSLARWVDPSPAQKGRADLEALLLASSIPQVPALLATVAAMGGARLLPVLLTLGVSTLGVVAQGVSRG